MHALTSVNFATGTAVVIRPDPLAVFRLRAWSRGYLWSICELDLHEAVDVLQAKAECDALVSRIGADGVQAILADAFHEFSSGLLSMRDWKQEARDAWDAPSWHKAAVESVKENSHPHPTSDNRSSIGNGKSPPRKNWSDRAFSAAELQTKTFPALKFIVPELVPEGATLLVSRPKLGKSWLVLDIAIAVASGRFTLGSMKPIQGDVLYLALEDGPRRLQRRLTKLLPTFGEKWPPRLKFATECLKADQGG